MANSIFFSQSSLHLSSRLPDIMVHTTNASVNVRLRCYGATLLDERYFPDESGNVTVRDLRSLVENHMRQVDECNLQFTIEAFNGSEDNELASEQINVLYCDRIVNVTDLDEVLRHQFLTAASALRIAPDGTFFLTYYGMIGDRTTYYFYCRYATADGGSEMASFLGGDSRVTLSADGPQYIICTVAEVEARLKELMGNNAVLQSFTVRCGNRAMTYFVDRSLRAADAFYFRNCFNCIEQLTVPMETVAKQKVERSVAKIDRDSTFYNQSETVEYEVQSAALTADEAMLCEQLFASHDARVARINPWDDNEFEVFDPILITDSTSERSDSDEKPNTVKFTWRYAANRPMLALGEPTGTFTEPYNFIFT